MLDKIKELLSNWKVTVALVGGALVVGTTFGTCTVEPGAEQAVETVEPVAETVGEEASTENSDNTVIQFQQFQQFQLRLTAILLPSK